KAVARSIKQRAGGFAERQFLLQKIGRRIVDGRKQITRLRIHYDESAAAEMKGGEARAQNIRGTHLQRGGDREMHVALALADSLHGGVIRLPSMAQQREKLAIVVADGVERLALRVFDFDDSRAIVVSLKTHRGIALDERGVRSAPVGARPNIAEKMKCHGSERIKARVGPIACLIDIDAELLVFGAVALEFIPVRSCERQAGAVVDASTFERAGGGDQARIVDKPAAAIGLY